MAEGSHLTVEVEVQPPGPEIPVKNGAGKEEQEMVMIAA